VRRAEDRPAVYSQAGEPPLERERRVVPEDGVEARVDDEEGVDDDLDRRRDEPPGRSANRGTWSATKRR